MLNNTDLEAFGYYDANEEGYKPQMTPLEMVKQYAKVSGQVPNHELYEDLIIEEYYEWVNAVDEAPENELKELADLVYVCYGYANALGWDLDEALRRVHENNMGRMYQPDGTIKRRADGKIEKNKDYPKVDLSNLV